MSVFAETQHKQWVIVVFTTRCIVCLNAKQIEGFSQVAALLKHAGHCDMPMWYDSAGTESKVEYNAVGQVN